MSGFVLSVIMMIAFTITMLSQSVALRRETRYGAYVNVSRHTIKVTATVYTIIASLLFVLTVIVSCMSDVGEPYTTKLIGGLFLVISAIFAFGGFTYKPSGSAAH